MKCTKLDAGFRVQPRLAGFSLAHLRRSCAPATAAAALMLLSFGSPASAKVTLDAPLIVTQVPAKVQAAPAHWDADHLVRSDWFDDARLVVVSPDGSVRVLSEGFASACDPDVSFDGRKVLFAGRKSGETRSRIWEIGLDGQGLRAISPEHLDARRPRYVSLLNTLESPQPWFTIVFVARETTASDSGRVAGSNLYNVKLDGSELRRLTFNPNYNLDPFQMWDGRLIYAAERHPNEPGTAGSRVGLQAMHIEGADMELYGGELGQRIQQMPCATAGGLVVFVESPQPTWDGAGQLGCVEQRRPHVTYRALTQDVAQQFFSPSALHGNQILVSRRAAKAGANWGVFAFDADHGACEAVFDQPEFHDVQAVLAGPHALPDGHSTVVTLAGEFGTFYGMNCYTTDAKRSPHLKRGEVKRVRFIEGVVPSDAATTPTSIHAAHGPAIPRRLIGEAAVESDGSFNVIVPADTPLLIQTLDEHGLALGNCGWVWVKPKEVRGCIGCHEDPELVPENDYVQALRRPSDKLLLPPNQRRSVTFRDDVAPILQQHCATAGCHGGKDTPLHLPLLTEKPRERDLHQAYEALTVPAETSAGSDVWPTAGRYVDAGRARTSWLIWQITGTNTSRPWDQPARSHKVTPMPAHGKMPPLPTDEIRTLIEWIDLGAQFGIVNAPAAETMKGSEAK